MRRRLALILTPLLVALVGAALGSVALFAVAIGILVVYAGCGAVVRVGVARLRVRRELDRQEVLEGRPLELRFTTAGLRGLPVHVEVQGADGGWTALPPGGGSVTCTIDRPGAHVVDASRLRVRDDLGLFTRSTRGGRASSVLVLPVPATAGIAPRRGGADPVGDPEPDGLRTYVRGTAMSRIHWASAARGGELQERNFATAQDRLPLVVVDTAGARDGALDWTARTAAGQVLALVRSGGCRVLLPGDRTPTTVLDPAGGWPALHRRLAALEPGAPPSVPGAEQGALHVRASGAPPEAAAARGPLPPGVVALSVWSAAA